MRGKLKVVSGRGTIWSGSSSQGPRSARTSPALWFPACRGERCSGFDTFGFGGGLQAGSKRNQQRRSRWAGGGGAGGSPAALWVTISLLDGGQAPPVYRVRRLAVQSGKPRPTPAQAGAPTRTSTFRVVRGRARTALDVEHVQVAVEMSCPSSERLDHVAVVRAVDLPVEGVWNVVRRDGYCPVFGETGSVSPLKTGWRCSPDSTPRTNGSAAFSSSGRARGDEPGGVEERRIFFFRGAVSNGISGYNPGSSAAARFRSASR